MLLISEAMTHLLIEAFLKSNDGFIIDDYLNDISKLNSLMNDSMENYDDVTIQWDEIIDKSDIFENALNLFKIK